MTVQQLIDTLEQVQNKGLQVEATPGNDPRGDIKVARKDSKEFLDLLGNTIDKKQQRRGA